MVWNAHYYDFLRHYYYEPQKLNRKSTGLQKTEAEVFADLSQQEVSLNHVLTLFFVLAPFFTSRLLLKLFGIKTANGRYHVYGRDIENNLRLKKAIQPDLFIVGTDALVSMELKIDHKTELGQVARYGLLHSLAEAYHQFQGDHFLIFAGPATFMDIWPKENPIQSVQQVKEQFPAYPLPERMGSFKLTQTHHQAIRNMIERIHLEFISYKDMGQLLEKENETLDMASPAGQVYHNLLEGVMQEFRDRSFL